MRAYQVALVVKQTNKKPGLQMLETLRGAQVWSLGPEDPLEEDVAAHSSNFS